MEKIFEIEKLAKSIGYTFLLRMDKENRWFVHFYKRFDFNKDYFCTYTDALEDTLDYLITKIKTDFDIKE